MIYRRRLRSPSDIISAKESPTLRKLAFGLVAAALFGPTALLAAVDEFVSLFDGKTLTGWLLVHKGSSTNGYMVEGDKIVCPRDGGGNLLTVREYSNFIFRFDFRMEPGGNNGIAIRAPISGNVSYTGMEIQILDHDHARYQGWLKPWQRHGSIYGVVPAKTGYLRPIGHWNEQEIVAKGSRITIKLNGHAIVDADLSTVTDPEVRKKHPGIKRTKGRVGFLGHGSRVEFRDIRIKELP